MLKLSSVDLDIIYFNTFSNSKLASIYIYNNCSGFEREDMRFSYVVKIEPGLNRNWIYQMNVCYLSSSLLF